MPALLAAPAHATPEKPKSLAFAGVECGIGESDKDGSAWNATAGGANMRSGPGVACAILGKASSGHRLDYHCYVFNELEGYIWTYLRDDNTNEYGWVRGDLLSDGGSFVHC
ncbi:SH3 domain-containing protein [Streptomyces sp. NPDC026672]|uniref:SH3 domain-containing protein n=1 Tax=unclassified Streptomyces TaxID=2593676 RepID=UPI0034096B53